MYKKISLTIAGAFAAAILFSLLGWWKLRSAAPTEPVQPSPAEAANAPSQLAPAPNPPPTVRAASPTRSVRVTAAPRGRVTDWQGLKIQGNTVTVSPSRFQFLTTKGLSSVLKTARVEPVIDKQKVTGFRLKSYSKGSLWEAAGFQHGDVFHAVNGIAIHDAAQAMKVLQTMRLQKEIRVSFARSGQPRTFTVLVK